MSKTDPSSVRRPLLRRAFLLALVPAVVLAGRLAKSEVFRVPTDDGGEWSITITPADRIVAAIEEPTAPLLEGEKLSPTFLEAGEIEPVDEPSTETVPSPQAQEAPVPMPPSPAPAVETPTFDSPRFYEVPDTGIAIIPNHSQLSRGDDYEQIYNSIPFSRAEYLANPSYRHDTTMELLTGTPRQTVVHRNYTPQLAGESQRSPLFLFNRYGGVGPYYGSGGVSSYHGGFGLGYRYVPQYAPAFRYFLPLEDLY